MNKLIELISLPTLLIWVYLVGYQIGKGHIAIGLLLLVIELGAIVAMYIHQLEPVNKKPYKEADPNYMCYACSQVFCDHRQYNSAKDFPDGTASYCNHGFKYDEFRRNLHEERIHPNKDRPFYAKFQ